MDYKLYKGDCLEVMDRLIEEGVKVDMILTDPPYGTTKCKWDTIIPFNEMWKRLNKLTRSDSAIALFGAEPFASALRVSNIENYKYNWYWKKTTVSGFANAKKMPLKDIETISIFYEKLPTYNPQGLIKIEAKAKKNSKTHTTREEKGITALNGGRFKGEYTQEYTNYPRQILEFASEKGLHLTQKPVPLLEYLIKTYTNEGDLVLDFTMGSGSTGAACLNTNRRFIGIELDEKYFNIAKNRLENIR